MNATSPAPVRPRNGLYAAMDARLRVLAATLDPSATGSRETAYDAVAGALSTAAPDIIWLTLAALDAELPTDAQVAAARRLIHLDGPAALLRRALTPTRNPLERRRMQRRVEVVSGAVLVDVTHTARTALATGIQRVARRSTARWAQRHDVVLLGWTPDERAMRRLTKAERDVALHGGTPGPVGPDTTVIVPWQSTYVLPELAIERQRTPRLLALARHSGNRTGVIGFDCVPLSTAETVGGGMAAAFAGNLAAVRHMDRVAAISHAAAREYEGWRAMLAGTGLLGPDVQAIPLAVERQETLDEAMARLRARLRTDDLPLVLVVGSHEPRKNHLAVLQAAELAWRTGSVFRLAFVGGNAWRDATFRERLDTLTAAERPVSSVTALDDDLLWAAYRLARVVVFPSLNEGFGLPVAEALASGTPVITSGFGSMAEIAAHGGALLVDPRDDASLAAALRAVVDDDALHARLSAEARTVPLRTWDAYADDVWNYLVERPRA